MTTPAEQSGLLHARVRGIIDAFETGTESPEDFDQLACDIARFQIDRSPGYARLCAGRTLASASDIPAVPTDVFKLTRVSAFPPEETPIVFRTSGTTREQRGEHFFRDVTTYDQGALAFGRSWLVRDLTARVPVVVLSPSPKEMPHSSLVHMCDRFARAFGPENAEPSFVIEGEVIDLSTFDEACARASGPMLVLGTSFAFVHLLDALGDMTFRLPPGSRVMQTGGFKGKSREVPAAELRAELARAFAIGERSIVCEYGMTELSSQFYEKTLFDSTATHGEYAEPPWARVIPVDPETLEPAQEGIAKIIDLANVDSAVAVLTQDRVRRVRGGFELLGRLPGAPPRGCSIAIDELLGR